MSWGLFILWLVGQGAALADGDSIVGVTWVATAPLRGGQLSGIVTGM